MSEIKYEDIYYMIKDVAYDQEDPIEAYKKIEKEIDHWKAEAERYEQAWRSVASDYNMILAEEQRLRKKVASLTAERDELKKVIDAQIEAGNEMMDDRDYWKRLAEAAGEVITYMEKSGMSIVPWNEIYKKYQSILKEGGR